MPDPAPTDRNAMAAQRDVLARQVAQADLRLIDAIEAALATPGVAQLRAVVADNFDPNNMGDAVNQQLSFIGTVLNNVPSALRDTRARLDAIVNATTVAKA